jgi:hypothetical protein
VRAGRLQRTTCPELSVTVATSQRSIAGVNPLRQQSTPAAVATSSANVQFH